MAIEVEGFVDDDEYYDIYIDEENIIKLNKLNNEQCAVLDYTFSDSKLSSYYWCYS